MGFKIPVLTLGSGITALGTVRALNRAGIPTFCTGGEPDVESWSRWYRPIAWHPLHGDKKNFVPFLTSLELEQAVLLPCSDYWIRAVSEIPPEISDRFMRSGPTLETQVLFIDKGAFSQTLNRLNIPQPSTFALTGEDDLLALAKSHDISNFFLKPRESQPFFKRYEVKGIFLTNVEQALASFRQVRNEGFEVVLQEFIPGTPDHHYYVEGFVNQHHDFHALFARKRLRMYPPKLGNSTAMVSVRLGEVEGAIASLDRLFHDVKFKGIFSAEFKRDARHGTFKVIEINIRPWWYIEFAAICGVNVAQMAYCDALGLKLPRCTAYREKKLSVNMYTDWHVFLKTRPKGLSTSFKFFKAWAFGYHTIFEWSDPWPSARWLWELFKQKSRFLNISRSLKKTAISVPVK